MKIEKNDLVSKKWKILIVLDACRFDYFKRFYKEFLEGKLKRGISPSTHTMEWLIKTFPDKYEDIIYVSANPFINSKMRRRVGKLSFLGREKFHKVIDVWDFGWDEYIHTVRPNEVNKAFFDVKDSYEDKRFVLHYMQPHYPYIHLSMEDEKSIVRKVENDSSKGIIQKIGEYMNMLGLNVRKIKRMLNRPSDQMGYILNNYGVERLRKEYERNLILVLEQVSEVVSKCDGKIVVTSDHGELLGEYGKIGHSETFDRHKELIEVPYLEISS